ncbi:hypothetical protein LR48_Vigan05g070400 [Vigna angularis]|uniref:Transposase Tnp1/En/Spm-like domain-containing protein n=1 Tax=Phaseolus angularis TaxID=3914 RepID=A0A0L9UJP6_PHAAN|nr:hypothetical protein LR48_Vigan05g070400 [Vigna angularis]
MALALKLKILMMSQLMKIEWNLLRFKVNLMKEVKKDGDGIRKELKKCKRREAASTAQRQFTAERHSRPPENWDIPNDERIRKKILSHIAVRWRDFKTRMTRQYVFGSKQNDTPCTKYKITEEEWVKRIAAQQRQKLNDTPHVLSHGGYALLEKKMRKRRVEELGLESPDLAPPPAIHELWKVARTKSNGQFTSQSTQEISERIDDLVDRQSQDTFMAQGRQDLLVAATGRLDRPGRVRAVGGAIGLRDYSGPKPRSTEAVTQEIQQQEQQEHQQQSQQEDAPIDDPTTPRVSTKASCSTADRLMLYCRSY